MCKFIFYAINNVLNENIIIFYFVVIIIIIIMNLKSQNAKKKYKEKIISIKKTKIINVDNNEENVYEKIILQDAEHDDNINLDGVD